MNVTCPDCRTVYRIDPRKIPLGGVRARCARCPSEFVVDEVDAGGELAPSGLAAAEAYASAESAGFDSAAESYASAESAGFDSAAELEQEKARTGPSSESATAYHAEGQWESDAADVESGALSAQSDLSADDYGAYADVRAEDAEAAPETYEVEPTLGLAEEADDSDDLPLIGSDEGEPEGVGYRPWGQEVEAADVVAESGGYTDEFEVEQAGGPLELSPVELESHHDSLEHERATPDLMAGRSAFETEQAPESETGYGTQRSEVAGSFEQDAPEVSATSRADGGEEETAATEAEYAPPVTRSAAGAETADLRTVEAVPEGFAAVPPKPDQDLELPPPPFGTNDPQARAKRLARALVSDIVAYHPDRRSRAIQQGTIRQEFREEIRKSWEEYVAHVGNQMARDTSYFRDALNELLAGGERAF